MVNKDVYIIHILHFLW